MEFLLECLCMLAIGFLCIAAPIMLLISLQWMPWYVCVSFAVWILACIGTIVFSESKDKKWFERLLPSFLFTIIFTLVFLCSIDTNYDMFDKNNAFWAIAPALCLPAFYQIGDWLSKKWLKKQEAARVEQIKEIDAQLRSKRIQLQHLQRSIRGKTAVVHLLELMDDCGNDVSQMQCDPRICDITKLTSEMDAIQNEISALKERKK